MAALQDRRGNGVACMWAQGKELLRCFVADPCADLTVQVTLQQGQLPSCLSVLSDT
jgi:hypothetical protein